MPVLPNKTCYSVAMPWSTCLQSTDPDSELVAGIGKVKVNLKGLNHTELCPVNNQLNFSSLQFKLE